MNGLVCKDTSNVFVFKYWDLNFEKLYLFHRQQKLEQDFNYGIQQWSYGQHFYISLNFFF